jgi:drug/metabolite transporter (DMT)-like permease
MHLPLSEAVALNMLAPVLASCIAAGLSRAPFHFDSILGIGSSFIGVILTLKPSIALGSGPDSHSRLIGIALACAGALGTGVRGNILQLPKTGDRWLTLEQKWL